MAALDPSGSERKAGKEEASFLPPRRSYLSSSEQSALPSATSAISSFPKESRRVRDMVCGGKIAVLFSLSSDEVMGGKSPAVSLCCLPRMGYLHMCTGPVRECLSKHTAAMIDGMWFECGWTQSALRWSLPIGVLFDTHCPATRRREAWPVTVHFQRYPPWHVMDRCDKLEHVQRAYFNSLKQALHLGFGSAKQLTALKMDDQNSLWRNVSQCSSTSQAQLAHYALAELCTTSCSKDAANGSDAIDATVKKDEGTAVESTSVVAAKRGVVHTIKAALKRFPVRILLNGFGPMLETTLAKTLVSTKPTGAAPPNLSCYNLTPIQRAIAVKSESAAAEGSHSPLTLESYLNQVIPGIVHLFKTTDDVSIQIQGINVPLDTAVLWIVEHLSHFDCFVYVCIRLNTH